MTLRREPWTTVEVAWVPAPQGSHIAPRKHVVLEANPKTQPYREAVAEGCRKQLGRGWVPLDGPLEAVVEFRLMPTPASDPDRAFHLTPPDIDKLLRSTFDALTMGGLWKDDARCSRVVMEKVHAPTEEATGVTIKVRRR